LVKQLYSEGDMDFSEVKYIGEMFALAAPICWSFAIILFRKTGDYVHPLALSLVKSIIAMILFVTTMLVLGQSIFMPVTGKEAALLVFSGVIGIGISDTLFFAALNRVGASRWAILNCLYSPTIIFMSVIFLGERLSLIQVGGVLLILGAVFVITYVKDIKDAAKPKQLLSGVLLAFAALATQGIAVVMIKPQLAEWPLLWANLWRIFGGAVAIILVLTFAPRRNYILSTLRSKKGWQAMVPAAIVGNYLSLLFWLGGMKYTLASVASSLNQTASIWTFILAAILLKEKVTKIKIIGLTIGLLGVVLVGLGK
jgi:drug/metabolite transporter (DMT)-like permease